MARAGSKLIDRIGDRRAVARWSRVAASAESLPFVELRDAKLRARALQKQISRVIATADARLTLPFSGAGVIRDSLSADWAWRPDAWRGAVTPHGMAGIQSGARFGEEVKIFHDCPRAENALRQVRNTSDSDMAPYALRLDVFGFEGSFLSVVVDLPAEGLRGLSMRHMLRVDAVIEAELPVPGFARLNLKHGPNTEQMVQGFDLFGGGDVEFDLGFTSINEARIESAWVELIFEVPNLNQILIRDMTVCRRPRAEL